MLENGFDVPRAAKGFFPVEALKLKVLADGAVKVCCCTPLMPFAPNTGVVELTPEKKDGADWVLDDGGPVGAGLRPGVRRRRLLLLASRILRLWSVSAAKSGTTRADARSYRLTFSVQAAPEWPWKGLGCSSCGQLWSQLLTWVDCGFEIRLVVWT